MTPPEHDFAELGSLIARLLDGQITGDEHAQLEARLLNDGAAQAFYHRYVALSTELAWEFGSAGARLPSLPLALAPEEQAAIETPFTPLWQRWWMVTLAGTLAVTSAAILFVSGLLPLSTAPALPAPVVAAAGEIVRLAGDVSLVGRDGKPAKLVAGQALLPGETLHAGDWHGTAGLQLADGTRLTLVGPAQLEPRANALAADQAERFYLGAGILCAEVESRAADSPLVIITPHAEVEVLGTRFTMACQPGGSTRIEMTSGRVRCRRTFDGAEIELKAGEFVEVDRSQRALSIEKLPSFVDAPQHVWSDGAAQWLSTLPENQNVLAVNAQSAHRWQPSTGETTGVCDLSGEKLLAVSSNGRFAAVASAGVIQARDLLTGEQRLRLERPTALASVAAWNASGNRLALAASEPNGVGCEIYSIEQSTLESTTPLPDCRNVAVLAWSPDEATLALDDRDGRVWIWPAEGTEQPRVVPLGKRAVMTLAFAPDSQLLAATTEEGGVTLVNVSTLETRTLATHVPASALAFSTDGLWLCGGLLDGHHRVWRVLNGQEYALVETRGEPLSAAAFALNASALVVAVPGRGLHWFDVSAQLKLQAGDTPSPSDLLKRQGR